MTKVCIWGAWYESSNAGDQAILMAIAQLLRERIADLELVVFSNRPRFTQAFMHPVYPVRALSQRHSFAQVLRELASCDLFLVGGGTPVYDDWFHLLAMFLLIGTTRLAGRPVMTYAISSRPIVSAWGKLMARASLNLVNLLTVRESRTLDLLHSLGIEQPIHTYVDPAVTLDPIGDIESRAILSTEGIELGAKPLLAVCPHFFSPDHSYRVHHYGNYSREAIDYYHQTLALAAEWLADQGQVLFIPMNTEAPDDDRETIDRVLALMGQRNNCFSINHQYGPRQIAGILRQCELACTVRLHSAILATSVLTPTVAISYGPKVEGYMSRIGQEANTIRFEELAAKDIRAKLALAWKDRLATRQTLAVSMQEMRKLATHTAEAAASLVKLTT